MCVGQRMSRTKAIAEPPVRSQTPISWIIGARSRDGLLVLVNWMEPPIPLNWASPPGCTSIKGGTGVSKRWQIWLRKGKANNNCGVGVPSPAIFRGLSLSGAPCCDARGTALVSSPPLLRLRLLKARPKNGLASPWCADKHWQTPNSPSTAIKERVSCSNLRPFPSHPHALRPGVGHHSTTIAPPPMWPSHRRGCK